MKYCRTNSSTPLFITLAILAVTLYFNAQSQNTEAQNTIEKSAAEIATGTPTIEPPTITPSVTWTPTPDTPTRTPTWDPSSSATAAATQTPNATLTAAASASAGAGATPTATATATPAPTISGVKCTCCTNCTTRPIEGQTCEQACATDPECALSCPTPGPNDNCTCATSQPPFCAFMSTRCMPTCSNCALPPVATEVPPIVPPAVGVVISTPITNPGSGNLECNLPSCPSYKFPQECSYQFGCYQLTWTFKPRCFLASNWPGSTGTISVGVCFPTGQIVDQCDKQACCAAVNKAVCELFGVKYCCNPSCNSQLGQIPCGGVCCDQAHCAYNLLNQPSICCDLNCSPDNGPTGGWCNCCGDGTCAVDEKAPGAHPCPTDCDTKTPTATATPVPPTITPSSTPIPATATPTKTVAATATPTATQTPLNCDECGVGGTCKIGDINCCLSKCDVCYGINPCKWINQPYFPSIPTTDCTASDQRVCGTKCCQAPLGTPVCNGDACGSTAGFTGSPCHGGLLCPTGWSCYQTNGQPALIGASTSSNRCCPPGVVPQPNKLVESGCVG
jgi:hypothetical protein